MEPAPPSGESRWMKLRTVLITVYSAKM
jgi:hypothetical protein